MIAPADFQLLAGIVRKRSGITLSEDKAYLLESRLLPVARSRNMQDIAQLCNALRSQPNEALLVEITEAMTTNESSFFRDIKPFEQLRNVIFPMLMQSAAASKTLRIWSAACSTGQEPYSIAISICEDAAKMPGWKFEIIASDLSQKVLNKAKQGIFSQFEVQRGLPIQMLIKYFNTLPDTTWQIQDHIRRMVNFQPRNLLDEYLTLGQFDLIFCRNVLIYFDEETKAKIIDKMARTLRPGGVLILGATETIIDPTNSFRPINELRGVYQRSGHGHAAAPGKAI